MSAVSQLFLIAFVMGWLGAFVTRAVYRMTSRRLSPPARGRADDTVPPALRSPPANAGPYRAPAERRSEPDLHQRLAFDAELESRNALALQVMRDVLERQVSGEELVAAMRRLLDAGVTQLEASDALHRAAAQVSTELATSHVAQVMADALGRRRLLT